MSEHQLPITAKTLLPVGSMDAYIQRVNDLPYLTADEEHELATRYQEQGDLAAAQQLVLSHLRYVVRVARGYMGYGLPLADLIQEGTVGLMKAVKRFDPNVGVRLVSFSVHWIKAEMHEFVLRNWRIVKVATTKAQRKLFFNLRSAKKRLGWNTSEEVNAIANDLGVPVQEVRRMEERLNSRDISFDLPSDEGSVESDKALVPADYLSATKANPEDQLESQQWERYTQEAFRQAFSTLDDRAQIILEKRWLSQGEKATLSALAEEFSVSPERIRQLEKNAIDKLKAAILGQ